MMGSITLEQMNQMVQAHSGLSSIVVHDRKLMCDMLLASHASAECKGHRNHQLTGSDSHIFMCTKFLKHI